VTRVLHIARIHYVESTVCDNEERKVVRSERNKKDGIFPTNLVNKISLDTSLPVD